MIRTKNFFSCKIVALGLALSILAGLLPPVLLYAVSFETMGTVETLVGGGTVNGDTVTFRGAELIWSPKDDTIGRNVDGWWVGIRVLAPEGMTEEQLKSSRYYSGSDKSFWAAKDSAAGAERHFIQLWGVVNEGYLNDAVAGGKLLEYRYGFDWDGDGEYEQPIVMQIDPTGLTLKKDGETVWPTGSSELALVETITDGLSAGSLGNVTVVELTEKIKLYWSAADAAAGRNADGWWLGVNVTAPAGCDLSNVTYQNKTSDGWSAAKSFNANKDTETGIQLWGLVNDTYLNNAVISQKNLNYQWRFDWNGDGVYEQLVHVKLDPAKPILMSENGEQVYPYLGTVVPLTGGTVSGNTSNLELLIEEATLS